jgi:hypothetical protein
MSHLYRKLSIAVVNSSLPEPYNSYGDHWIDGFKDAGCDVTVFPYDQISYIPPKFDLYFFVEIRYKLSDIPWYLNPRVLYSWDSHLMDANAFEIPAHNFDKIFLASKIDVENLHKAGVMNIAWVPEACNPRVHKNLHLDRTENLGFIGNLNNTIIRNGFTKNDFVNYFKPYHKTHVWGEQYTEEQNKIKIMFDRTINYNIGTRIFESSAAGCVPLWSKVGYPTGIEELLEEGVHYIPYADTIEDLDRVLKNLNESQMSAVVEKAESHVLNNHTYAHRVKQILKILNINYTSFPSTTFR